MAKARATRSKVRRKQWLTIIAPKIFNNQPVGETLVAEQRLAIGKSVPVNLMDLTHDIKKQNIQITLKVNAVTESKAQTEVTGYVMSTSSIRRLVRRNRNKISNSFLVKTNEGKKVRIKPLVLTRAKTSHKAVDAIRKQSQELLTKNIAKISFESLIQELVSHKLQVTVKKQLNKIYPIKSLEILALKIEPEKHKKEEKKPKQKKEEPKKEEKEAGEETEKTEEGEGSGEAEETEEGSEEAESSEDIVGEEPEETEENTETNEKKEDLENSE